MVTDCVTSRKVLTNLGKVLCLLIFIWGEKKKNRKGRTCIGLEVSPLNVGKILAVDMLVLSLKASATHHADPALTRDRRRNGAGGGHVLPRQCNRAVEEKPGRQLGSGGEVALETRLNPRGRRDRCYSRDF